MFHFHKRFARSILLVVAGSISGAAMTSAAGQDQLPSVSGLESFRMLISEDGMELDDETKANQEKEDASTEEKLPEEKLPEEKLPEEKLPEEKLPGEKLPEEDSATESIKKELEAEQRTRERLAMLRKPVREIDVFQREGGVTIPENRAAEWMNQTSFRVIESGVTPVPTYDRYPICSSHQRLYFEECDLERCGRGHGCATNALSSFRFLTNTTVWPLRLIKQPAWECVTHGIDCKTCPD